MGIKSKMSQKVPVLGKVKILVFCLFLESHPFKLGFFLVQSIKEIALIRSAKTVTLHFSEQKGMILGNVNVRMCRSFSDFSL